MRPINPNIRNVVNPQSSLRQSQSVYKSLSGGIELAIPTGQNSAGVYNKFDKANHAGVMIRIGASGTSEQTYKWPGADAPLQINHGLLKQPLGFYVTDIDGAANIYRYKSAPLNANTISLATTDPSVNVTVFIF